MSTNYSISFFTLVSFIFFLQVIQGGPLPPCYIHTPHCSFTSSPSTLGTDTPDGPPSTMSYSPEDLMETVTGLVDEEVDTFLITELIPLCLAEVGQVGVSISCVSDGVHSRLRRSSWRGLNLLCLRNFVRRWGKKWWRKWASSWQERLWMRPCTRIESGKIYTTKKLIKSVEM